MDPFTAAWLGLFAAAVGLETWALTHDHRNTLSQTLQRAFAHSPWVTLFAFGAFAAWFSVHIWGRLLNRRKKK